MLVCAYVDCEAPLAYFKSWIMKFYKNCEVPTISFVGPAPRLWVEAMARPQNRQHNVLLMNKILVYTTILLDM